ncbi:MAG: nucleotidyltransferase domain-containing protein [Spirochaetaceae bacterium]|jgi:predicted nucleotidyltransferase|nr:nucleotidyltransferase domain-containing protein [Spirochaetaceae bacterium]
METSHTLSSIRPELDLLTKAIVATVPTEQVYLFGSYAYGTPTEKSDLDIYVVLKDDAPMRDIDAMHAIRFAIAPIQTMPIDLLAIKKDRFYYRSTGFATVEKDVLNKGVRLYG